MTTCVIGEPCITETMMIVEMNPEPFILLPDIDWGDGKLVQVLQEPGPMFGPYLEDFIGRENLIEFMFSGPPLPDPSAVPLPATALLLLIGIAFLGIKKVFSHV